MIRWLFGKPVGPGDASKHLTYYRARFWCSRGYFLGMDYAYSAADLVNVPCKTTTYLYALLIGKPVVLVPSPNVS